MLSKWTQHVKDDPRAIENFEHDMRSFRNVLDRLKSIIEDMEKDLTRAECDPRNYDTPNWDYRQAHNNGYRSALSHIKKFVDLDEQEKETISNDHRLIRSKQPTTF